MTLTVNILDILNWHNDGQEFFDALFYMVRCDIDILSQFYDFYWKTVYRPNITNSDYNLVMSGSFGLSMISNFGKTLFHNFNRVLLVNGGLREGKPIELYTSELNDKPFIFLDDSYYSGRTRNTIEQALQELNPLSIIAKTIVIYDGSSEKKEHSFVESMYKYHKEE